MVVMELGKCCPDKEIFFVPAIPWEKLAELEEETKIAGNRRLLRMVEVV